jgi:hypothetical protein
MVYAAASTRKHRTNEHNHLKVYVLAFMFSHTGRSNAPWGEYTIPKKHCRKIATPYAHPFGASPVGAGILGEGTPPSSTVHATWYLRKLFASKGQQGSDVCLLVPMPWVCIAMPPVSMAIPVHMPLAPMVRLRVPLEVSGGILNVPPRNRTWLTFGTDIKCGCLP